MEFNVFFSNCESKLLTFIAWTTDKNLCGTRYAVPLNIQDNSFVKQITVFPQVICTYILFSHYVLK